MGIDWETILGAEGADLAEAYESRAMEAFLKEQEEEGKTCHSSCAYTPCTWSMEDSFDDADCDDEDADFADDESESFTDDGNADFADESIGGDYDEDNADPGRKSDGPEDLDELDSLDGLDIPADQDGSSDLPF